MSGPERAREFLELASEAGLERDPRAMRWVYWATRTDHRVLGQFVRETLGGRAAARILMQHGFAIPKSPAEVGGCIDFGYEVVTGARVGFNLDEPHLLCLGTTRLGKSNLALVIISRILGRVPFWAFDSKQDLRHVATRYPDVYPLRLDGLRFNPLCPPAGMPSRNSYQVLFDIFCQGEDLLSGSKAYGLSILERLFEGYPTRPPTMAEFRDLVAGELKKLRPSSVLGRYAERLWIRLESVLGIFGEVFDCEVGFPMDELVRENLIIEGDGIETLAAQFMIRSLLFANYHWRVATGQQSNEARQLLIVDEAQELFDPSEEKQYASGIPFINRLVQRAGGYGMFLLALSQSGRLSLAIRENSRVMVTFGLMDGPGRADVADIMGMDEDQEAAIGSLGVGDAIVRIGGRCPDPIAVRVDHLPIEKDMTDEVVARHVAPLLARLGSRVVHAEPVVVETVDETRDEGALTWGEEALLRDVHQSPVLDWTQRSARLDELHGLGPTAARNARDRLKRRGFVELVSVKKAAKRGSSFRGLVLMPRGRDFLRERGVRVGKAGRGGPVHTFWVEGGRAHFEGLGFACEIESELADGVFVDLLVSGDDGQRIAVEVELSTDTAIRNIEKLVPLGLDQIIIAVDGTKRLEAVERKCRRERSDGSLAQVEFRLVQCFLPNADGP